jgi:hypothetical protein
MEARLPVGPTSVDPVADVVQPDQSPLNRVDEQRSAFRVVGRLRRRVHHRPRETREPERAAFDDPLVGEPAASDREPSDVARPMCGRNQDVNATAGSRRRPTVKLEGGRPREPALRSGIQERGHVALRKSRKSGFEQDDPGKQQPPRASEPPADLGTGNAGLNELNSRHDAELVAGEGEKVSRKVHDLHADPRQSNEKEPRLRVWTT